MSQIFICYRREDSEDIAGRIYDRLQDHFRKEHVFFDIDSILAGDNVQENINKAMRQCQVFLAIIGKDWLHVKDKSKRRIKCKKDYVRLEIEAALKHKVHLIPVLVGGALMPSKGKLPPTFETTDAQ